jgi:hypothetical protein
MGEEKIRNENKKKEFEKDPDKFFSMDEVVCLVKINNVGELEPVINISKAGNLPTALGLIMLDIPKALNYAAYVAHKASKPGIIRPGGNGELLLTPGGN